MVPLDINKESGITQDQARNAPAEQIPTLIHKHREEVTWMVQEQTESLRRRMDVASRLTDNPLVIRAGGRNDD